MTGKKPVSLTVSPQLGPSSYSQYLKNLQDNAKKGQPFHGWLFLPSETSHLKESQKWAKACPKSQDTLVVLGIGGSCLGPRAVYDFVQPKRKVVFLDNVDGYHFEQVLKTLNFKKTHFLAISKSGETFETLFQVAHVMQELSSRKLKFQNHLSVISEENSGKLRQVAMEHKLAFLPMPKDVGGRFSVLTAVGLAPLAWAGVNVKEILSGARLISQETNLVGQMTQFYAESFLREEWISVFWSYVDGLKTFGLWIEQLWAESLAKKSRRTGGSAPRSSTPLSCIGATDQHSLLQQFVEGARDKSFTFIRCRESETSRKIKKVFSPSLKMAAGKSLGELLAIEANSTRKTLHDLGIHSSELVIEDHSEESIGALLFLFELVVGCMGEWLEIDAFNQPGVEGVKKAIRASLSFDLD